MSVEISVGPPVLTINQGDTFMVTDKSGEISAESEQGLFSRDTRFLSHYKIYANGEPWQLLSSATPNYYTSRIYLSNRGFETLERRIEPFTLSMCLIREVGEGISELIQISNFGADRAQFTLEVVLRSDFADIFDVRSGDLVRRGNIFTHWDAENLMMKTSYCREDFYRHYIYRLLICGSPAHLANGRITLDVDIAAGSTWYIAARHELVLTKEVPQFQDYKVGDKTVLDELQIAWQTRATKIKTSNEEVYRFFTRSVEDMGGLRLYEQELSPDSFTPAAGVPWYVTLFGRDSLIASLQTMIVNSKFSLGTLKRLAEFQAREMDDFRDSEPGKIPHELRFGELAHFKKTPHSPYYGTADATALYLVVLHETWKWLGKKSLLQEYRDVAVRCLDWIDHYGDLDGDGLQEFKTRSPCGYENMCWKDSGDAIVYGDGTQVKQPKGVCELQGYVFDAWMRMAEVFDQLGETERSAELRRKALELRQKFMEKYWCDETGFIALALDGQKKQSTAIASNAGHCLWSGIVPADRAESVVRRMFKRDMWSGWGIRTLSTDNRAYNPHSYHRGSVWPHDNGIIALGFKRYGFAAEAARVFRDISEAASEFTSHRIPELYAGVEREPDTFPVQYLHANVPQAWAAGSVFHLLQAILGLQADAPNGRLYVDPALPRWLPDLKLQGLDVGDSVIDLDFWTERDKTGWEAHVREGTIKVEQKAWTPWAV